MHDGNNSNTFEQRHGYMAEQGSVTSRPTWLYKVTTMRIHDYTDDSKSKVCEPYKLHDNACIYLVSSQLIVFK